jgi:hypothetical protein
MNKRKPLLKSDTQDIDEDQLALLKDGAYELESEFDIYLFFFRCWEKGKRKVRFKMVGTFLFIVYLVLNFLLIGFLLKRIARLPESRLSVSTITIQLILSLFLFIMFLKEINQGLRLVFTSKLASVVGFIQIAISIITYFVSIEVGVRATEMIDVVQNFGAFAVLIEFDNYIVVPLEMLMVTPGYLDKWNHKKEKYSRIVIRKEWRRHYIMANYVFYFLFLMYTFLRATLSYEGFFTEKEVAFSLRESL